MTRQLDLSFDAGPMASATGRPVAWRALTLTRPWPYAILVLGKAIENRSDVRGMPPMCRYRGPLLLHAAKGWDATVADRLYDAGLAPAPHEYMMRHEPNHPAMAIVGRCTVVGHVEPWRHGEHVVPRLIVGPPELSTTSTTGKQREPIGDRRIVVAADDQVAYALALDLRWWMGGHALLLADIHETRVIPCRGFQGMWRPPASVLQQLEIS